MTGIEPEPQGFDNLGSLQKRFCGFFGTLCIESGIGLGVEFHSVGSYGSGSSGGFCIGIDKNGHADVVLVELCYHVAQERSVFAGIPVMVGGQLSWFVGDESNLCGLHFADKVAEFLGRESFDVELRSEARLELSNITISDMSFVGTRVYGDALCSETLAVEGY